ncbi:MAG TPA: hypothetical protein IGS53_25045 [Leptolyngbyaceae cyanobacterium M33_DOE_097]|nr:hypothetical protein [Leptolyngbyaceae cyanobacterium M33_DOE_097]
MSTLQSNMLAAAIANPAAFDIASKTTDAVLDARFNYCQYGSDVFSAVILNWKTDTR